MREACVKFGIKVSPSVGIVGDPKFISKFTGQEAEKFGGSPVNAPDCNMTNGKIVNNSCLAEFRPGKK